MNSKIKELKELGEKEIISGYRSYTYTPKGGYSYKEKVWESPKCEICGCPIEPQIKASLCPRCLKLETLLFQIKDTKKKLNQLKYIKSRKKEAPKLTPEQIDTRYQLDSFAKAINFELTPDKVQVIEVNRNNIETIRSYIPNIRLGDTVKFRLD